jgi:hypothetical protein
VVYVVKRSPFCRELNIEKQVAYWRDGAVEDWEIAQELIPTFVQPEVIR